jgi:hypothetical protein
MSTRQLETLSRQHLSPPDCLGLSVSNAYRPIRPGQRPPPVRLCERLLDQYEFVAVVLKWEDVCAGCEGHRLEGPGPRPDGHRERADVCGVPADIERGLRAEPGLLCIIEGAKGCIPPFGRCSEPKP